MPGKKQYHIWANSGGCPQNQLDAAQTADYLEKNGYQWTSSAREADIIIANTCAYHTCKENESINAVKQFSDISKPGCEIVLTGCLPKIAPERVKSLDNVKIVIPATELAELPETLELNTIEWDQCEKNHVPEFMFDYAKPFRKHLARILRFLRKSPGNIRRHVDSLLMYDHSPSSYLVRVGEGCLGNCAYCAIRKSRGKLNSKPLETILEEVRLGVNEGHDEILLTATELSAWGRDQGKNLADLLEAILEIPGKFDLHLFYANPRWLIDIQDRLEPIFATGRITFLHASINGTSDAVLRIMGRGYSLRQCRSLFRMIRTRSSHTVLQTQVLVGFPGETEEDYNEIIKFLKYNYFHNVQVHAFDPRPGTRAADMDKQVPESVRIQRRNELYKITLLQKLRWNLGYVAHGFRPPYSTNIHGDE